MIEPSWLGCEQTTGAIRVAELGKETGTSRVAEGENVKTVLFLGTGNYD
jgi:hypothetical protein